MEFSSEITNDMLPLNKEECVKNVQQMFGQELSKSDSGKFCTWTVPTSIFIGFRPLDISTCEQHCVDSEGRSTVKVNIFNPVEKRTQTESLREDKFSVGLGDFQARLFAAALKTTAFSARGFTRTHTQRAF